MIRIGRYCIRDFNLVMRALLGSWLHCIDRASRTRRVVVALVARARVCFSRTPGASCALRRTLLSFSEDIAGGRRGVRAAPIDAPPSPPSGESGSRPLAPFVLGLERDRC